jgi:hypothetical protein
LHFFFPAISSGTRQESEPEPIVSPHAAAHRRVANGLLAQRSS